MTNRSELLERLRSANPLPDHDAIDPSELVGLFSMVEERRSAEARPRVSTPVGSGGSGDRLPRWALALSAAVMVLLVGAGAWLLTRQWSGDEITETTGIDESPSTEPAPAEPRDGAVPTPAEPEAPADPEVPAEPIPEWTTFTTSEGLPGDDDPVRDNERLEKIRQLDEALARSQGRPEVQRRIDHLRHDIWMFAAKAQQQDERVVPSELGDALGNLFWIHRRRKPTIKIESLSIYL